MYCAFLTSSLCSTCLAHLNVLDLTKFEGPPLRYYSQHPVLRYSVCVINVGRNTRFYTRKKQRLKIGLIGRGTATTKHVAGVRSSVLVQNPTTHRLRESVRAEVTTSLFKFSSSQELIPIKSLFPFADLTSPTENKIRSEGKPWPRRVPMGKEMRHSKATFLR